VAGKPRLPDGGTRTDLVADSLRESILSGEWDDGYKLPTNKELSTQYGVSVDTVREALKVLAGGGLIDMGQGRVARVSIRQPAHRLVVHQAQAGHPQVTEPPLTWLPGGRTRKERRKWNESTVPLPRGYALLLDLEPRVAMLERTMRLIIDEDTVLASISYLPVDLAGAGKAWQKVEIGQLAVSGYGVTSEFMEFHERMPTPTERDLLGMPKNVLINIVSHPCRVLKPPESKVRAGVIVLARSDLIRMRWYRPARLTLPPE
jgi:Bacterial regulatory proteins, gntR family